MGNFKVRYSSTKNFRYVEKLRDLSRIPQRIPDFKSKNIVVNISTEQAKLGPKAIEEKISKIIWEYAWLDFLMFEKDIK